MQKHLIRNTVIAGILAIVLAYVFGQKAFAQSTRFALDKPILEVSGVPHCATQKEAIALADAYEKGETAFVKAFKESSCGRMVAYFTYKRLIYQNSLWNVYEAKWGGRTVYVLTDWEHIPRQPKAGET